MFGPVFNAVSPTPSTLPDIEQALGKYLLNECSHQQVFDCELLSSRVFLLGRNLDLNKIQYIKCMQQILGLGADKLGFEAYMA